MSERARFRTSVHGPLERIVLWIDQPDLGPSMSTTVHRVGEILIDAGSTRSAPALIEALTDRPPRRIVLTHQHEDHTGGVPALRRAFGDLEVFAPALHIPYLESTDRIPAYRAWCWGHPEPFSGMTAYGEGDVFETGSVSLEAIGTPGHTPGHFALIGRAGGRWYAVTADLFISPAPVAMWYESSAGDLIASCRRVAAMGEEMTMLPTHGRPREDGGAALRQLADWTSRQTDGVHADSERLGTRDFLEIARARYGPPSSRAELSQGEFSSVCLVRAVLDPVVELPATHLPWK